MYRKYHVAIYMGDLLTMSTYTDDVNEAYETAEMYNTIGGEVYAIVIEQEPGTGI